MPNVYVFGGGHTNYDVQNDSRAIQHVQSEGEVMWAIQYLDHDEGSCARWNDLNVPHQETHELARNLLRTIRKKYDDGFMENSYSYRIAEVGSELYYSQPTDKFEY